MAVFSIRPSTKVSVNKYYQEIKPIMILQRAFGRFPYSFNKQGYAPFKLFSLPFLYTFVYTIVLSVWTIYSMSIIAKRKIYTAPSYDVALYWVSFDLLLVLNLSSPLTKWLDSSKHIQLVRLWHEFQEKHMDSEMEMRLTRPVQIIAVLLLPWSILFVTVETYILSDLPLTVTLPFISAIASGISTLIYWCATLYELRAAASVLLEKIIMNGCRQMSTYRRSWLELSKLVSGVGESHAFTGMTILVISFASIVLSIYAVLSSLFQSRFSVHFWGLLVGTLIGLICDIILCDSAHKTTQEIGSDFSSKILALDLTHLNQAEMNEISLLLQTMSAHPPLLEFLGFVTINRDLLVTAISKAVTYLVVLVQFQVSSPLNPIDEKTQQ